MICYFMIHHPDISHRQCTARRILIRGRQITFPATVQFFLPILYMFVQSFHKRWDCQVYSVSLAQKSVQFSGDFRSWHWIASEVLFTVQCMLWLNITRHRNFANVLLWSFKKLMLNFDFSLKTTILFYAFPQSDNAKRWEEQISWEYCGDVSMIIECVLSRRPERQECRN